MATDIFKEINELGASILKTTPVAPGTAMVGSDVSLGDKRGPDEKRKINPKATPKDQLFPQNDSDNPKELDYLDDFKDDKD